MPCCCGISDECLAMFRSRASDAQKIGYIDKDDNLDEVAKKIQLAEIFQIVYFGAQTILYGLAVMGMVSPVVPSIVTLSLLPVQIFASQQSMVLYGHITRIFLAFASVVSLALVGGFALRGSLGDFSWTSCGGCFLVHCVRMLGEHSDYERKKILQNLSFKT